MQLEEHLLSLASNLATEMCIELPATEPEVKLEPSTCFQNMDDSVEAETSIPQPETP